jgi:hypothetical protein
MDDSNCALDFFATFNSVPVFITPILAEACAYSVSLGSGLSYHPTNHGFLHPLP